MGKSLKGCNILEISTTNATSYAGKFLRQQGAYVEKFLLTEWFTYDYQKDILNKINDDRNWNLVLIDCFDQKRPIFKDIPTIYIDFQAFQHGDEYELQANCGWMSLTGNDTEHIKIGGNPASILIGSHIAFLAVCQLLEQKSSFTIDVEKILLSALHGKIERVDVSIGNIQLYKENVPMNLAPTTDGYIFIGAPNDEQWDLLKQWAELKIQNTSTNDERLKLKSTIYHQLSNWSLNQNKMELMEVAQAFRLPFGSVQTYEEIIQCPQHTHRAFIKDDQISCAPWKESVGLAASQPFSFTSFKNLQILDLTAMWAGPYCSRLLADLGAKVVKIEAPHRPDGIRGKNGMSTLYKELNRNKYSVALDLRKPEEREVFLNIVKDSHIVLNNFSPRVMENFQLTPEYLTNYNDGLIYASLSAFGQTGPFRNFVGYGSTLESMGGIVAKTTSRNDKPILPGFSISDMTAGVIGAFAIVLAIFEQQSFRAMRSIDVSQYEVATLIAWENSNNKLYNHKSVSIKDIIAQKAASIIEDNENWWFQNNRDIKRFNASKLGEHTHLFI